MIFWFIFLKFASSCSQSKQPQVVMSQIDENLPCRARGFSHNLLASLRRSESRFTMKQSHQGTINHRGGAKSWAGTCKHFGTCVINVQTSPDIEWPQPGKDLPLFVSEFVICNIKELGQMTESWKSLMSSYWAFTLSVGTTQQLLCARLWPRDGLEAASDARWHSWICTSKKDWRHRD